MQTIKAYVYHQSNPSFAVTATSNISDVDAVNKALEAAFIDNKAAIMVKVTSVYNNGEEIVYVCTLHKYLQDTK